MKRSKNAYLSFPFSLSNVIKSSDNNRIDIVRDNVHKRLGLRFLPLSTKWKGYF